MEDPCITAIKKLSRIDTSTSRVKSRLTWMRIVREKGDQARVQITTRKATKFITRSYGPAARGNRRSVKEKRAWRTFRV